MKTTAENSRSQRVVLGIFFSMFLLVGSGFFYFMTLRPMFQGYAARAWLETPCLVISSNVVKSSSDGPTYQVEISYAYEVHGRSYQSDRYQFLRFSSSGRSAKELVVRRYPKGSRAVCYVNPSNPGEAVLDRTPFPSGLWAFFPLIFVGVGAGGAVYAIFGKKTASAFTDEPWMQRQDWAAGRIASESSGIGFLGVFALFWNGISFPLTWQVLCQQVSKKGDYGQLMVLLFPLIGLVLLGVLLWQGWRRVRFGRSYFEMDAVPGAIGGLLQGGIRLEKALYPKGPVKLKLSGNVRMAGDSPSERVQWLQELEIPVEPGCRVLPVAFRIPSDAQPTTVTDGGPGVFWRLEARATVPGIDYKARWEVPVYEVELLPGEAAAPEGEGSPTG